MKELLDKLSSYYLFNCVVPGAIIVYACGLGVPKNCLLDENVLIVGILYYFVGLVNNRVGALVVEPIAKSVFKARFVNYESFVLALGRDGKLDLFSEICNMYRSLVAMPVVIMFVVIIRQLFGQITIYDREIICFCILIGLIFALSYRKQIRLIAKRVAASGKNAGGNQEGRTK